MKKWLVTKTIPLRRIVEAETREEAKQIVEDMGEINANTGEVKITAVPVKDERGWWEKARCPRCHYIGNWKKIDEVDLIYECPECGLRTKGKDIVEGKGKVNEIDNPDFLKRECEARGEKNES